MSAIGAVLWAILAIGAGPTEEDEDVTLIDKPELTKMELEAARLETQVTARVPSAPELSVARGDTIFVEIELPLSRPPKGPLEGRVSEMRGSRDVKLVPWLEPVLPQDGVKTTRMLYAVRAMPGAAEGKQKITAVLSVHDAPEGPAIATKAIQHTITVGPAATKDLDVIELDRRAYLYHQTVAMEAYKALPSLHDYLRLDRVDPPPSSSRVAEKDRAAMASFLHHRLRADIAASRLRAAAELADPKIAEAAVMAIGSLSKKPTGPAARATAIDGESTARAFELASAALDDLRIDEAEGILARLRRSEKLTRDELAHCLELLAVVYAVRARDEDAKRLHGQVLCIDPKPDLGLRRAMLRAIAQRPFERERVAPHACTHRLAVSTVTAVRESTNEGVMIVVHAAFGPDARELITGGDIELWSGGGAKTTASKIRAVHDGSGMGEIEARFPESEELLNYAGQLLVKIYLREVSGVAIADAGDPDPMALAITDAPSMGGIDLPWWVYAIAAGAVAIGTATAVAVVKHNQPTQHGIGPIVAEF